MVLYYLSTSGIPYFQPPEDETEGAVERFRGEAQRRLCQDDFEPQLRNVRGTAFRCALPLALVTSADHRGTAEEVLLAFLRGAQGLVSTVSKTRGVANLVARLGVIAEDHRREHLQSSGGMTGSIDPVLQEQLDVRQQAGAMSTMLGRLVVDGLRMPYLFLVLPEDKHRVPRPQEWFAGKGRLFFLCCHDLEPVPCGGDGQGFLVSQPKASARTNFVYATKELRL